MNKYKRMRLAAGLTVRDMETIMKPFYPKFSKMALSLAENSQASGITLTPAAARTMGELLNYVKAERRTRPCRWSFRVVESVDSVLNALQQLEGYSTKDAFLQHIVLQYIEKAAAPAGTETTANTKIPVYSLPFAIEFVKEDV